MAPSGPAAIEAGAVRADVCRELGDRAAGSCGEGRDPRLVDVVPALSAAVAFASVGASLTRARPPVS